MCTSGGSPPPTLTCVTEIIDSDWITTVTSHTHTHTSAHLALTEGNTQPQVHASLGGDYTQMLAHTHTHTHTHIPRLTLINTQVHAWAAHEPSCRPNVERVSKESAQWMHLSIRFLWVFTSWFETVWSSDYSSRRHCQFSDCPDKYDRGREAVFCFGELEAFQKCPWLQNPDMVYRSCKGKVQLLQF